MKRLVPWIALAIVLLAGGTLAFVLLQGPGSKTLVLSHPWNRAADVQALQQILAKFHSLYPHLTVQLKESDATGADVSAVAGYTADQRLGFAGEPVAWTGGLWVLAARKDVLERTAKSLPTEVQALRDGTAGPEQFRTLLKTVAAEGTTPLTLGNSHKWPFLLWLQHWAAATQGPDAVQSIPADLEPLAPAFQELVAWKNQGWFVKDVWSAGWAQGLAPLDDGRAAFALVSEGNLGAVQPQHLSQLEFLPFPRAPGGPRWSVGSAVYLVAAKASDPADATLLVRYLTSPGVTEELTRLTNRPFFSWKPGAEAATPVLPSWADAAMTAPYNALSERFDPAK